jgi:hypothetical protein
LTNERSRSGSDIQHRQDTILLTVCFRKVILIEVHMPKRAATLTTATGTQRDLTCKGP